MLRSYFIAGLLLWIPIGITLWVLDTIIAALDLSLYWLPAEWQPVTLFGRHLPGIGALLTLSIVFLTGVFARNFLGERLVKLWEGLLARIPIVNALYASIKQVSDTLLSPQGKAFRKALLVEYPRRGAWTIAFLTGSPADEVRRKIGVDADEMVSVYVPTTPNPTSGFFLMVKREDTLELEMTVDAALKYVVSMGVVSPLDPGRLPVSTPPQTLNAERP